MGGDRTWYLDTSVALFLMLRQSRSALNWYATTAADTVASSRLLSLECARVLRRDGLDPAIAEQLTEEIVLLNVDNRLLAEAAAIGPHVKTLDALHLASAMRLGVDGVTLVTHDRTMLAVGHALGFEVLDPVAHA